MCDARYLLVLGTAAALGAVLTGGALLGTGFGAGFAAGSAVPPMLGVVVCLYRRAIGRISFVQAGGKFHCMSCVFLTVRKYSSALNGLRLRFWCPSGETTEIPIAATIASDVPRNCATLSRRSHEVAMPDIGP